MGASNIILLRNIAHMIADLLRIYLYISIRIYSMIFPGWLKKNTGYDWILFESWKTSKINGLRLHPWHGTRIPDMAWKWKGAFNGRKCHPYHNHHSSTIITHHGHPSAKKNVFQAKGLKNAVLASRQRFDTVRFHLKLGSSGIPQHLIILVGISQAEKCYH